MSVAVRLALQHPDLVAQLALLWPATASDPDVDAQIPAAAEHLIAGETLRGVADHELTTLDLPVAIMRSEPENAVHRHHTVHRLVRLISGATPIEPGCPESPRPDFAPHLGSFIAALTPHL